MTIADNLKRIHSQIVTACAKVNRHPSDVMLIAVSKQHPITDILQAYDVGQRHFGENRVEEMQQKYPQLAHLDIVWHMIGHIQSRKARDVPAYFSTVHSVDSLRLAQKLADATSKTSKTLDVLIQINISGEVSKSGFVATDWTNRADVRRELWESVQQIYRLPHLRVVGLMTMAFIADDPEQTRPVFAGLRQLRDALVDDLHIDLPHLSMGMTDDFMVAIEEGATIIRIGRAIFGE